MSEIPLLSVNELFVEFSTDEGIVKAVNGATFTLTAGQRLGLVGESASGKSVTALTVMQLSKFSGARVTKGSVNFNGINLLDLPEKELRQLRGAQVAMIFQDPMNSLNPYLRISEQIAEVLRLHRQLNRQQAKDRSIELLKLVGIPKAEQRYLDFPHQFSGGMRQRIMIAMAIACEPDLLIADEPTTALDVSIQAQIMELLDQLSRTMKMATMLITHDLAVVASFCDYLCIMYAGRIVEQGSVEKIFSQAKHPYTKGLLASIPHLDQAKREKLYSIPGQPPNVIELPPCCPFFPRCQQRQAVEKDFGYPICQDKIPPPQQFEQQQASCWLYQIKSNKGAN